MLIIMVWTVLLCLGMLAAAETSAEPAARRRRVDLETQGPTLIRKIDPEYTAAARRVKLEGVVVVYVEIGIDGRVHNARIIQRLGLGLDQKAIEALLKWRFSPGVKNGAPVVTPATIEVNFRLQERNPSVKI